MKHITSIAASAATLLAGIVGVAAQTSLNEIAFNIDGTVSDFIRSASPPGAFGTAVSVSGVNLAGFDTGTGLGTIQYSVTGPGAHSFYASFFDIESDFGLGPANDTGSAHGTVAGGQHWEIGQYDPATGGAVYADVAAGTLTDANSLINPTPPPTTITTDVAMAMGFAFGLSAGDTATVLLHSSVNAPASGFYLEQDNTLSGKANYLYGTLNIAPSGTGGSVPDAGSTLFALTFALTGLGTLKYRLGRN